MIWSNPKKNEYLVIQAYAQKVKYVIMTANDSILSAQVKHTQNANHW